MVIPNLRRFDLPGWVQAILAACIAAAASVFWAGNVSSDVAAQDKRLATVEQAQKQDHDKVTSIDAKLADLQADVSDIKSDVKTLVNRK